MEDLIRLASELSKIQDAIDNSEVVTPNSLALFESSLSTLKDKVGFFVQLRANLETKIKIASACIVAAKEEKERHEASLKALDESGIEALTKFPDVRFTNGEVALGLRKSEAVIIEDESKIPSEFMIATMVFKPDKKALKEAIDRGLIIEGVSLEQRKHIKVT